MARDMAAEFLDAELEAYLDESLDAVRSAEIESAMRADRTLAQRLAIINSRRDAGVHTLSEIWRRNQIGVPTREKMEQYLAKSLGREEMDYIRFRLEVLKCRFTTALMADISGQQRDSAKQESTSRRSKYYQSGAKYLERRKGRK